MPAPLSEAKVASCRNTLAIPNITLEEAAAIEHVSTSVLSQINHGTYRPGLWNRRDRINRIRHLLADGYTGREIARQVGVHESTVSKIKREMIRNGEL